MLAEDVGKVFVYAPKDFVGIMIAVIDLRSPGGWLMDNQLVQLEWTQRTDERSAPSRTDRSRHQRPTSSIPRNSQFFSSTSWIRVTSYRLAFC
jgi:hypothetical protein